MTPQQIANLAADYAASLRRALAVLPPMFSPTVAAILASTAAELERLSVQSLDEDPKAIAKIFRLLGSPAGLRDDFGTAIAEAERALNRTTPGIDD